MVSELVALTMSLSQRFFATWDIYFPYFSNIFLGALHQTFVAHFLLGWVSLLYMAEYKRCLMRLH